MSERITAIFADQIADIALGDGIKKQVADDSIMELALKANDGLVFDTGEVTVDYDDSTIGIISNKIAIKDGGVTEAKLDVFNAPTIGEYMKFTANGLEWSDVDDDFVGDDDVICNEIPTGLINSSNVDYDLDNTPIVGTVTVYLNGMFQAQGSALDYTISGTTITFTKAPRTNSDLYVCYIK